jgi:predicted AAA+ superfamily ATPase
MFKGKAIIVYGARQTGKTTLIEGLLKKYRNSILTIDGDEPDARDSLVGATSAKLRTMIGENKIIYIDEAQKIPGIGNTMKLITDKIKNVQLIATGSSSFELADRTPESLTGRKYEYRLFPLSIEEMVKHTGILEEKRMLEHRMIEGYYPEIVSKPNEGKRLLRLIAGSYLFKDIFGLSTLRNPTLVEKLAKAIALQIGSEVSYTEVARLIGADKNTVEKYLNILEQAFIIFKLPALCKNERGEIKKGKKYYFYDNGIRNAVIGNFSPLQTRTDVGALWENFVISERKKYLAYHNSEAQMYFWRTKLQQKIDLIEEHHDGYNAFEIKWNPERRVKFSKSFLDNYAVKETRAINRSNIEEFVL